MKKNRKEINKIMLFLDAALALVLVFVLVASVFTISAPKEVSALELVESTYSTARIKWEKSSNADGYRVYRAENNHEFEYLDSTVDNEFYDTNLITGTKYKYAVVSRNGLKTTHLNTRKSLEVQPTLDTPKVEVSTDKGKVELKISKVEGATAYEITRDGNPVKQISDTVFIDEEATTDEEHSYKVKAVRYKKNPVYSLASNTVEAELHSIPNFVVEADQKNITLDWEASDYYDEYKIYLEGQLLEETQDTECTIDDYKLDDIYNIKLVGTASESKVQSPELSKRIKVIEEPLDNAGARKAACDWGVDIASDDSFAYGTGQTAHRPGCYFCGTNVSKKGHGYEKTYCCNPFVHACYAHGAGDPQMLKDCQKGRSVGMDASNYTKYGNWEKIGRPSISELEAGDVLINPGHVMLYIGDGELVHAKTEGWGAGTITTDSCSRYYGMVKFVMRYTGTGSGTMYSVKEVDEKGNVIGGATA